MQDYDEKHAARPRRRLGRPGRRSHMVDIVRDGSPRIRQQLAPQWRLTARLNDYGGKNAHQLPRRLGSTYWDGSSTPKIQVVENDHTQAVTSAEKHPLILDPRLSLRMKGGKESARCGQRIVIWVSELRDTQQKSWVDDKESTTEDNSNRISSSLFPRYFVHGKPIRNVFHELNGGR